MTFRVGQKVVCVDAGNYRWPGKVWLSGEEIFEGNVYTIKAIGESHGETCCQLYEVARITNSPQSTEGVWGYGCYRFRPAVDRKTDISVFTVILHKKKERA